MGLKESCVRGGGLFGLFEVDTGQSLGGGMGGLGGWKKSIGVGERGGLGCS